MKQKLDEKAGVERFVRNEKVAGAIPAESMLCFLTAKFVL